MEKIALVTGSSRGIGRAVARRLAAEGYAVCVNYRERQDCAMSLVAEISAAGGRAMAVQADVAHRVQVNEMVRRVEGELGPVSLLVNSACPATPALFTSSDTGPKVSSTRRTMASTWSRWDTSAWTIMARQPSAVSCSSSDRAQSSRTR